jgi:hypothetical protein
VKNASIGCAIVLAATLAAIGLWWLIANLAGTADGGPRPMTYSTPNHRSST